MIAFIEDAILDESRSAPDRLVLGRLRLGIQTSTRHDDRLHTPIARCEWVRNRGATSVRGLRSRASQTKTKARYWAASYLSVKPGNEAWLPTTMELAMQAHGATWIRDDHFGQACSSDRISF